MDLSNLVPNFDTILPDMLHKENTFVLVVDTKTDATDELESALKNDSYKVETLEHPSKAAFTKAANGSVTAVIMTPSDKTLEAVQNAMSAGIDKLWIDIGSETREVLDFLEKQSVKYVYQLPFAREALNQGASDAIKDQRRDS